METDSWSDPLRASKYVELFASAPDDAIASLLDAAKCQRGQKALDLCCGHGNVSEALRTRGCAVSGLDFSPSMLELARKRVPEVTFVQGDAQELPFNANDFDIVVSNFGICHVPDQPRALSEVNRVLRKGGHFAMTVWCGPDISPCFDLLYGAVKAHGSKDVSVPAGPDFHQFAKVETAKELLCSAGFSDVRLRVVNCFFNLDRPERLCEIFEKGTVRAANLLAAQPPERLTAIRSAVATAVRSRFASGERWCVPMPASLASARK
ncbi:MAG TPA: methyltransferase domain-containing protein [Burkholderiales bacterium]|nr:methyltransferase domain-containing protein [Burkholderiales bacterium]